MNLLKSDLDLFSDTVYCFTPNGDVKTLPAGSTPLILRITCIPRSGTG